MSYACEKETELQKIVIAPEIKADLKEFWENEVNKMRNVPLDVKREKISTPYDKVFSTYEISFNTHDNTIVNAFFSFPADKEGKKLPCVCYYHGGNGSKDIHLPIVSTGVCCLAIDVRSQGGTSMDHGEYKMGDFRGSLMTRDVLYKESFYMRNIYLDAIRTVDVAASLAEVDENKIVTYGASQGGALSLVASIFSGKAQKSYSAVPSYACLKQRVELGSGIFGPLNQFLTKYPQHTDTVFDTLAYFDINNLATLCKTPASFMVGLSDPICIPKFVYSIYSNTASQKEVMLVPFTPHTIADEYMNFVFDEFSKL